MQLSSQPNLERNLMRRCMHRVSARCQGGGKREDGSDSQRSKRQQAGGAHVLQALLQGRSAHQAQRAAPLQHRQQHQAGHRLQEGGKAQLVEHSAQSNRELLRDGA
jgi:hypothetical protein